MIQRTAIWILATLALCSPGTVVTQQTREPIGAHYEVWSIQIASDGFRETISRIIYCPSSDIGESVGFIPEHFARSVRQIYFGSLYNRPPPATLL